MISIGKYGRSGGIRTHDPFTPSKVRYQAALRSDTGRLYAPPRHRAIPFRQEKSVSATRSDQDKIVTLGYGETVNNIGF